MKQIMLFLLICSCGNLLGQSIYGDTLCGTFYCLDCGEDNKADFKANTLTEYFKLKLVKSNLLNIDGNIQVQIIIDKQGNVCCKHIVNNTNADSSKIAALNLQNIVNSMPKWIPAKTKGVSLISSVLVNIGINKLVVAASIQRLDTKQWIIEKID